FSSYLGEDKDSWKEWDASELVKEAGMPPVLITQGIQDEFYPKQLDETIFLKNAQKNNQVVNYKKIEGYDHSYFFIATFLEEH
ncbi:alpha/beta hydrolase-fold protein, partial [Acinetobacter baumannii]